MASRRDRIQSRKRKTHYYTLDCAANGRGLTTSESYSGKHTMHRVIKAFARRHPGFDLFLDGKLVVVKPSKSKKVVKDKLVLRVDKKDYYYTVDGSNGKVLSTSETYKSKYNAIRAIQKLAARHPEFEVDLDMVDGSQKRLVGLNPDT